MCEQAINECEALAVLVMVCTFAQELEGKDVTIYVDNDAALGALRKASQLHVS